MYIRPILILIVLATKVHNPFLKEATYHDMKFFNHISTKEGADYAHHITARCHLKFCYVNFLINYLFMKSMYIPIDS